MKIQIQPIRPPARPIKSRPDGCVCDPREWTGDVGPICDHYEPEREGIDACGWCEHSFSCHKRKNRLPDEDFV